MDLEWETSVIEERYVFVEQTELGSTDVMEGGGVKTDE